MMALEKVIPLKKIWQFFGYLYVIDVWGVHKNLKCPKRPIIIWKPVENGCSVSPMMIVSGLGWEKGGGSSNGDGGLFQLEKNSEDLFLKGPSWVHLIS